nr:hypothetical protein [Mucispirillum sp.]
FLYSKLLFIFKTVPATFFYSLPLGWKKVSLQKTLTIAEATYFAEDNLAAKPVEPFYKNSSLNFYNHAQPK